MHVLRGTDKILGATIVSPDAGNLISEVTVAMQAGLGIGALANVIHPYPTQVLFYCLKFKVLAAAHHKP